MSTELRVTLPGPQGSADARRSLVVLTQFLALLGHLEDSALNQTASKPDDRTTWGITEIEMGSLVTTLAPNRLKRGATTVVLDQVARTVVGGFAEAEVHEGLPDGWSLKSAGAAAELARQLGLLAADGMLIEILNGGHVLSRVTVTRQSEENLQSALKTRQQSIGSVIGKLDTISVHRGRHAWLWTERTNDRVEVSFGDDQTDQIRAALGQRVEIVGRLTRNAENRVISVKMRDLEVLPAGRPITDLIGLDPDFTGDLTTEEYLEEIRGAS